MDTFTFFQFSTKKKNMSGNADYRLIASIRDLHSTIDTKAFGFAEPVIVCAVLLLNLWGLTHNEPFCIGIKRDRTTA